MATLLLPTRLSLFPRQRLERDIELVAIAPTLRQAQVDPLCLAFLLLSLLFGICLGFIICGLWVARFLRELLLQPKARHEAFTPTCEHVHHEYYITRVFICPVVDNVAGMPVADPIRLRKPPLPSCFLNGSPGSEAAGALPTSADPSRRSERRNCDQQEAPSDRQIFPSSTAESRNQLESAILQTPATRRSVKTDALDPTTDGVTAPRPASDHNPSSSLPYLVQQSTPPKAPPASGLTPPENDPSGATIPQPAPELPRPKLKASRNRNKRRKTSASTSKRHEGCVQETPPITLALPHERCEQHVRPQPDSKSKYKRGGPAAPSALRQTQARPSFDVEPSGVRCAVNDQPTKGRTGGRGSSRQSASGSGRKGISGNGAPTGPPFGGEGNSAGSGNGNQDPDQNPQRDPTQNTQSRALFFRCPLHAAKPDGSDPRKCKHWRSASIAAVTRHALVDAVEDSQEWHQIKALSSAKLDAKERWKRYFVIFNNNDETEEMKQPYWAEADTRGTVSELLSIAMSVLDVGEHSTPTYLRLVHEYDRLYLRKEQNDKNIRARCNAEKLAAINTAMQKEINDLMRSQYQFDEDFARLIAPFVSEDTPRATNAHLLRSPVTSRVTGSTQDFRGLELPMGTPMHRTLSAGYSDIETNHNNETPLLDLPTNPDYLTVPTQNPLAYMGNLQNSSRQNARPMAPQPLAQFFNDTETVLNPETDPRTRERVQRRQNARHRRSQIPRPPHRDLHSSDSALGSSMQSGLGATSSTVSTQAYTPTNSLGLNYFPAMNPTASFVFDHGVDDYMDFDREFSAVYGAQQQG